MTDTDYEFQKVYNTFHLKILRYLKRLVNKHDAEDLTQEVFVKVRQALKHFRGNSQLFTWIYRIATNTALDKLRRPSYQRIVRKRLSDDSIKKNEAEVEDKNVWTGEKTPSIEQQFVRNEMNQCIRNFVENIPSDYRAIFVLSELEGLKNNKIAEILDVTLATVKIRLHRARAKLKKELESNCSFYHDEQNEFVCEPRSAFKDFQVTD